MDQRVIAFFEFCEELVLEAAVTAAERNRQPMPPQRIRDEVPFELIRDARFTAIRETVYRVGFRRLTERGLLLREQDPHSPNEWAYRVAASLLDRVAMAARSPENGAGGPSQVRPQEAAQNEETSA